MCNRNIISSIFSALTVALLLLFASELHAEEEEFSKANQLLFFTDHLASIASESTLNYEFNHQSKVDDGYRDVVKERIVKVQESGSKNIEVSMFSGKRHRYVPEFTDVRGNPAITLFLQRDVNEMDGLTEGTWRYFHREIKFALQDDAEVEDVQFTFDGKPVNGWKISISPYANDPRSDQLGEYANKYYTFTLSDRIPGYIYEIAAITPSKAAEKNTTNVSSDILTYSGIKCADSEICVVQESTTE